MTVKRPTVGSITLDQIVYDEPVTKVIEVRSDDGTVTTVTLRFRPFKAVVKFQELEDGDGHKGC